jgi:hypothetical protein
VTVRQSQLWRQDNPAFSLAERTRSPGVACYFDFRDLQSIESNVRRAARETSIGGTKSGQNLRAAPKGLLEL